MLEIATVTRVTIDLHDLIFPPRNPGEPVFQKQWFGISKLTWLFPVNTVTEFDTLVGPIRVLSLVTFLKTCAARDPPEKSDNIGENRLFHITRIDFWLHCIHQQSHK